MVEEGKWISRAKLVNKISFGGIIAVLVLLILIVIYSTMSYVGTSIFNLILMMAVGLSALFFLSLILSWIFYAISKKQNEQNNRIYVKPMIFYSIGIVIGALLVFLLSYFGVLTPTCQGLTEKCFAGPSWLCGSDEMSATSESSRGQHDGSILIAITNMDAEAHTLDNISLSVDGDSENCAVVQLAGCDSTVIPTPYSMARKEQQCFYASGCGLVEDDGVNVEVTFDTFLTDAGNMYTKQQTLHATMRVT